MPIEPINIEKFLHLAKEFPVLDVRSPEEFSHAHIPGAISLPLFTDDQRKIIGTAYKQQSRQIAVDHGLNYFSERMKIIPREVLQLLNERSQKNSLDSSPSSQGLLVHCWRGGMRSEAVAWLLNLSGYKVYLLKGGYKSFRNWALAQFEKKYPLKILGGYTGSGKTDLLKAMQAKEKKIIDLEKLANHKGSAFGSLGEAPQPMQEMFENLLAMQLWKSYDDEKSYLSKGHDYTKTSNDAVWLEDESRNIGTVNIPRPFWDQMRNSNVYFLDIPFEDRLNYIVATYSIFDKKELVTSIMKIQKKLGGLETKNAINFLLENNTKDCFSILISYYDKLYDKALLKRENIETIFNKVVCNSVNAKNADQFC